jgi:WD40 repeat protein
VNTIKDAHKGKAILSIKVSPDGSFLVSGGDLHETSAIIWKFDKNFEKKHTLSHPHGIQDILITKNSDYIYTCSMHTIFTFKLLQDN